MRGWLVGAIVLAFGIGVLAVVGNGGAAEKEAGDPAAVIDKIAATLDKGEADAAKKQSEALAKKIEGVGDVMDLFKPRKPDGKGGLGVGDKPGDIKPDGIEKKIMELGKTELKKDAAGKEAVAIAQLANRSAAVGHVAEARSKDEGKKDPKSWQKWSQDMQEASQDLAKAAKAKDTAKIKTAANKLNATCNDCHAKFRD